MSWEEGKPVLNYPQQLVREEAERLTEKMEKQMKFLKVGLGLPERAYTYGWDSPVSIGRDDYVVVPPNSYNPTPAVGRVIRVMETPDFTGTVTVLNQRALTDVVQAEVQQGKPFLVEDDVL